MSVIKVYTAIVGDKGTRSDDIECFTDFDKFKLPVFNAKIYKILAHQYIDADISIWLDGNRELAVDKEKVAEMLGDNDIALFKHFARDCIYTEMPEAMARYRQDEVIIRQSILDQAVYYKQKGYPPNNGLYECGMIIRRHNKIMEAFNNAWWAEICRHSNRDQLSFPYVLSKFPKLKVKGIEGNIRNHEYFKYKNDYRNLK